MTKYDPADRDPNGYYVGTEDPTSDHGSVEAAYLDAVSAFAADAEVTSLSIREPEVAGSLNFGLEPNIQGYGLSGIFPPDLDGYHDGAVVSIEAGRELVRSMLRGYGAWCRLESGTRLQVHVGYDQYLYISSSTSCDQAVAATHRLGLFAESVGESPNRWRPDEAPPRPADDAFWMEVLSLLAGDDTLLLEETFVRNRSRWHRITRDGLERVRAALKPRAVLQIWPGLSADASAALPAFQDESFRVVWEDHAGLISNRYIEPETFAAAMASLEGSRAIVVISDQRNPLLAAVLQDPDGILRARWTY